MRRIMILTLMATVSLSLGITNIVLAQVTFTEIAASAGVTTPADQNGSSVVDFDADGLEDLVLEGFVGSGRTLVLYHNNGNGTFSDVTSSWPGLPTTNVTFISWADFDNDGDVDVVIIVSGLELKFFRNNRIGTGEQSFTLIQTVVFPTGIRELTAWADFDNDGDLDVFVGGRPGADQLLRNNLKESGTTSFTNVTSLVGLPSTDAFTVSAHWIDADNDGDSDLFVVNAFTRNMSFPLIPSRFYRNLLTETGTASFEEVTGAVGFHTSPIPSAAAVFGDSDNDGDQDLYVGQGFFTANLLYQNNLESGGLGFTEVAGALGVQRPIDAGGIGLWGDLDNDGDLDLWATVGGGCSVGALQEPIC